MATPQNFTIQQVFDVLLQDTVTKSIIAYLDDCKTSTVNTEAELVYAMGGKGNVYIGRAFGHSRRAKAEIQKAVINTEVLAVQSGSEVIIGSNTGTVKYDVLTVTSDAAVTTFKALGTVGAEIGEVQVISENGTVIDTLTQDAAVAAGKFTYTPGTKTITFDAAELADGAKIRLAYNFDAGTTAQTVKVTTDNFPGLALVTMYGLVADKCTGQLFPFQIKGTAQIDPNFSFELSADGDPAVQNLNLEFVKSCSGNELYEMIVYNEDDAV